ncbi:YceI family protein [Mangrovimonas sp. TPBH4]|uniref:YceI family protein n=1 Tax=Mangrovimonas sp. TPBH4 TaxID=1645914 RepID=UPI0006B4ED12|nr:YceI family protein [Mangrovimonas sp. TPBH4]
MKKITLTNSIMSLTFGLCLCFISFQVSAQTFTLNNSSSKLTVEGTSSLHDWEEVAEKQKGSIVIDNSGAEPSISSLSVEIEAESLKSGKSAMDKNTYTALKTKSNKTISFKLTKVKSISKVSDGKFKVSATGDLSIAGVTNSTDLDFTMEVSGSTVKLNGSKSFKMSTFKIDPPTAVFGTVKTGDEVTIKFSSVLNQ